MSVDQSLRKAKSLAKKGDVGAAETLIRSLIDRYPDNRRLQDELQALGGPQAPKRRGPALTQEEANALVALYRQGRTREALSHGLTLAARHPGVAFLHNIIGACYAALGQVEQAAESYRHALALDANAADVHNNLAEALTRLGRPADAAESAKRALAIRPDFPEALNNLGNALNHLNRQAEAVAALEKALKLKPGYPEALNNLGNAHNDLGQRDEVIAAYEAALAARPGFADCWRNLASIRRFKEGDPAIGQM